MKSNTLFTASAIIAGAAVAFGATALTFAQAPATTASANPTAIEHNAPGWRHGGANLTDEQKAAMETKRAEMQANYDKIQAAITAGDYNAWKALMPTDSPLLKLITADNFNKFVQMHTLMDQAKAIGDELGLPGHHDFEMGDHMGFGGHMMHDFDNDTETNDDNGANTTTSQQ